MPSFPGALTPPQPGGLRRRGILSWKRGQWDDRIVVEKLQTNMRVAIKFKKAAHLCPAMEPWQALMGNQNQCRLPG